MSEKTVKLNTPILVEGSEVAELNVREPTVKELRVVGKILGETDSNLKLTELVTGLPPSSLDQLTAKDYGRVQKVIGDFLEDGQETGES